MIEHLHTQEEAAHERARQALLERQEAERVRDAEARRAALQERDRQAIDASFDEIEDKATETIPTEVNRGSTLNKIKRAVVSNPLLDDGNPQLLIGMAFLAFAVLPIAGVLDFIVLANVALFLLGMIGVTSTVGLFIGKLVLPAAILGLETGVAYFREKSERHRRVLRFLTQGLPVVVTVILIATFLAGQGIDSLLDLDLITALLLVGLTVLAFASHAVIIYFGHHIFTGLAYMRLTAMRRRFNQLNTKYERQCREVFHAFQRHLRTVDGYNEQYDAQVQDQRERLSERARSIINRCAGKQIVPPSGDDPDDGSAAPVAEVHPLRPTGSSGASTMDS